MMRKELGGRGEEGVREGGEEVGVGGGSLTGKLNGNRKHTGLDLARGELG